MTVRLVVGTLFPLLCLSTSVAVAQVINGESTADSAFAPRPPARWHSPEASGALAGGAGADVDDDVRDRRSEPVPRGRVR